MNLGGYIYIFYSILNTTYTIKWRSNSATVDPDPDLQPDLRCDQFSSNSLEPFLWCLEVWDMERTVESEEQWAQRTMATLVRRRWAPFKHEKVVWKVKTKQKRKHSEDFFCWRGCLLLKVDCLTLWELVHSEDVCISESLWKPQATPHLLRRLALCAHGATQEANRWCLWPVLGWEA